MNKSPSGLLTPRSLVFEDAASIPAVYVARPMLHPNIFRKRILRIEGRPKPGDWVAVYSTTAPMSRPTEDDSPLVPSYGKGDESEGHPDSEPNPSPYRKSKYSQSRISSPPASRYQGGRTTQSTSSDHTPQLFGYGLFNDRSEVAVRVYRWWGQLPNEAFWDELIDRAISLRVETLKLDAIADAYRVIHGESDGFPGLVVDRYGDCLSAEIFSLGCINEPTPS